MLCALLLVIGLLITHDCQALNITYMGLGAGRDQYFTDLLTAALKHAEGGPHKVARYIHDLPHHRSFYFLEKNQDIDLVIAYATTERHEKYLALPIPLMKGINGWRVSFVHKDNVDIFKEVKSLKALKKFIPGQFHAWTDAKILAENGLIPATSSEFLGLYALLDKKRIDYYPRFFGEIDLELNNPGLKIGPLKNLLADPHIILIYPTAFHFYANKQNDKLFELLLNGFDKIIANGTFDNIFQQYFGSALDKVRSEKRQVFYLQNSFLPPINPAREKQLLEKY